MITVAGQDYFAYVHDQVFAHTGRTQNGTPPLGLARHPAAVELLTRGKVEAHRGASGQGIRHATTAATSAIGCRDGSSARHTSNGADTR